MPAFPDGKNGTISLSLASGADREKAVHRVRAFGRELGFSGVGLEELSLVVTELGTNGEKYGGGGAQLSLAAYRENGNRGMEITYSSPGGGRPAAAKPASLSLGIGLDVIRNHVDEFLLGTDESDRMSLCLRKILPSGTPPRFLVEASAFSMPAIGQMSNGDGFMVERSRNRIFLAVYDALGHGPGAHLVSDAIRKVLLGSEGWDLEARMRRCQRALEGTRGAAMASVSFDLRTGEGSYAGVGNVDVRWLASAQKISLVPVPGILGRPAQRHRKVDFVLERAGVFLLASDGISLRHLDEDLKAVNPVHPFDFSHHMIRERGRPNDDRTILVAHVRRTTTD